MGYFAKIDENGNVENVIVASQEFINSGAVGNPNNWIETFRDADGKPEKRMVFASKGYTYDVEDDNFIPKKPFNSWLFDKTNHKWKAPKDKPTLPPQAPFFWAWDENTGDWEKKFNVRCACGACEDIERETCPSFNN